MVGRGADGPPPMEVEAVMALRLSRLTGKTALGGIGVAGEFAGLDTPRESWVKPYCSGEDVTVKTASLLSQSGSLYVWAGQLNRILRRIDRSMRVCA